MLLNGTDRRLEVRTDRYAELLPVGSLWHDALTGATLHITPRMIFAPRAALLLLRD